MTIKKPVNLIEWLRKLPKETEWAEFKLNNSNPESIGKYVSALANSAIYNGEPNGYLVFGVEDGTHNLVGTNVNIAAEKVGGESLLHWLNKLISPSLNIEHCRHEIDGKVFEILRIDPAYKHPVRFKGEAYIRIDESLHPLSKHPQREAAVWQAVNRFSFEDTHAATSYSKDDIVHHFFVDEIVKQLVEGRSKDGAIGYLEQEKLIQPHSEGGYDITNLLVLAAARNFTDWPGLERKGVRFIRYKGNSKLEAEEEIDGVFGYFVAFERALNFIMNRTPHREEMRHGLRQTTYDIPRIAIREILANAIIHQDFTIPGFGPTVEIFSDRIVITNPGKPLVDPDRFIDAPSRTRNNNLADLMRRLGVCEERGSGIDRAFTEIELAGLPPPLIQQVSDCTVVTIFGPRPFAQMTKEERLRACYFHACLRAEKNDFMSNSSLRQRFRLSQKQYPQVSEVIKEACDAALIKPLSEDQANRNARYLPYWY